MKTITPIIQESKEKILPEIVEKDGLRVDIDDVGGILFVDFNKKDITEEQKQDIFSLRQRDDVSFIKEYETKYAEFDKTIRAQFEK
jgi:hypothetical protein